MWLETLHNRKKNYVVPTVNSNSFTIILSRYEPIGSNYDSTDRHYNFSIRRARCLHLMSHQTEKYKIMLRMFPNWESIVVGGTDGVFLFPTVQYTHHHHHHHHPIINSCPNTIQNRKSPDDGPLDKNRIPPKNDDRYALGTPQMPHMFANTHHPSWPS
jgi:hypothetical protein